MPDQPPHRRLRFEEMTMDQIAQVRDDASETPERRAAAQRTLVLLRDDRFRHEDAIRRGTDWQEPPMVPAWGPGPRIVGTRDEYEAIRGRLDPRRMVLATFPVPRRDVFVDVPIDTPGKILWRIQQFRSFETVMRIARVGLQMVHETLLTFPGFWEIGPSPVPAADWIARAAAGIDVALGGPGSRQDTIDTVRFNYDPLIQYLDAVGENVDFAEDMGPGASTYFINDPFTLPAIVYRWVEEGLLDAFRDLRRTNFDRRSLPEWRSVAYAWAWLACHPDLFWIAGRTPERGHVEMAAAMPISDSWAPFFVAPTIRSREHRMYHEDPSIFDPTPLDTPQNHFFTARANEWWARVRGELPFLDAYSPDPF